MGEISLTPPGEGKGMVSKVMIPLTVTVIVYIAGLGALWVAIKNFD